MPKREDVAISQSIDAAQLPGIPEAFHRFTWKRRMAARQVAAFVYEAVAPRSHFEKPVRLAEAKYAEGKYEEALELVAGSAFDFHIRALRVRDDANLALAGC